MIAAALVFARLAVLLTALCVFVVGLSVALVRTVAAGDPYLTGDAKDSPRNVFVYISDDGDILGLRFDNFKFVFMEQRCKGTLQVWPEPFTRLRMPKIFNLRTDPFEYADITSNTYYDCFVHHGFMVLQAQATASTFAETFEDFPAIQRPNTFTIDDALLVRRQAFRDD